MKNSAERYLLSPGMKMAQLLERDDSLPGVFNRMGLQYGFGDATVEEICAAKGIDPETFLLICRVHVQDGYRPTAEALAQASIPDIVRYLRISHTYYLQMGLRMVEEGLERMIRPCDARSQVILRRFYKEYKEELARHFEYEEAHVFPYVETGSSASFKVNEFEGAHESMEEKLEDLKSLLVKYLPEGCDPEATCQVVFLLYTLSGDIRHHIVLEDALLAPHLAPRERTVLESLQESAQGNVLSQREQEILVCVAKGMLNKEIADQLDLSIHTVITHRKNITRKTGIKTVAGLTVYALLNHLIDMNSVE